jgi:hypothetical protein
VTHTPFSWASWITLHNPFVADLSTSNRNAIYELGVRHALRPYTTVIIAEDGIMKSPFFDLSHIVIRTYRHLGEDIGVKEMMRFNAELTGAIKDILAKEPDLRRDRAAAKSPLPTACVSWCRSAPFTPVPIRSTSVRSEA